MYRRLLDAGRLAIVDADPREYRDTENEIIFTR